MAEGGPAARLRADPHRQRLGWPAPARSCAGPRRPAPGCGAPRRAGRAQFGPARWLSAHFLRPNRAKTGPCAPPVLKITGQQLVMPATGTRKPPAQGRGARRKLDPAAPASPAPGLNLPNIADSPKPKQLLNALPVVRNDAAPGTFSVGYAVHSICGLGAVYKPSQMRKRRVCGCSGAAPHRHIVVDIIF